MGEVWRALKVGPQGYAWSRQVALKIILPMFAREAQFREMFIAEARIAASLVHPNIVAVTDFGVEKDMLWLEQELVDGTNGSRLIEHAPAGMPLPLAMYVACEALKGLAHAHAHETTMGGVGSIVHRDIKPSNLLVSKDGNVKLTDFGIAKVVRGDPSQTEIKGTIGYLAPELLEGHAPTERSDQFAMGLVLWELLTGRKLFGGETEAARLFKTYECVVPPLAQVGCAVPPEVEGVMRRMLARAPAERFPSAHDALVALLGAPGGRAATSMDLKAYMPSIGLRPASVTIPPLATSGTPVRTTTVAGETSGSRRRWWRRWPVLAALGVMVAAASAGVLMAVNGGEAPAAPAAATAPAPAELAPAEPDPAATAAPPLPPPAAPAPVVPVVVTPDAAPPPPPAPPPVAAAAPDAGVEITRNPPERSPTTKVGSRRTERPAPKSKTRSDRDILLEPE
jgi:hypothetical protein